MHPCLLVPVSLALCEVLPSFSSILLLKKKVTVCPTSTLSTQEVSVAKAVVTEVQYQLKDTLCWLRSG